LKYHLNRYCIQKALLKVAREIMDARNHIVMSPTSTPNLAQGSDIAMTVRAAVLDLLRAFGMTSIFGNPGSTELPLFRSFPKDFRYVLGLQEAVVVGMADGYAQATHNAAFVNLHSAAGVGNAMGNIFTAYRNRTPLVITAGQQARSILPYEPFLFSAQATELPKPYVKWSCEPARAEDVPLAIARAYYTAMLPPRGPVLVSIPADDWEKPCEPVAVRVVSTGIRPEPRVLDAIGEALDTALRPAFVVGAAVDRDGAWNDMVRLAERHNAAVWVAPMSGRCSFPEDHPLFAGFLPPMREKIVNLLAGHDVIFALGAAAFTYHVEGAGPHLPAGARLVQLIDDPNIAAWTPQGMSAVGSIRLGVLDLLAREAPRPRGRPAARRPSPRVEPSTPMSVAFVMQTLAEIRDPAAIVVEEAPSSRQAMQGYLPILRSETFYTMCSGGLGYAMPAAVGVALGKPDAKVIGLIGDGSSMYSIQALWSAAQLALPITFIVLKNRRYAALQEFAPTFGFGPDEPLAGSELPDIDFVALARGQGCRGVNVNSAQHLRDALIDALQASVPTLMEVDVA
jgi:benzoylformate decarboxylase